MAEVLVLVEHAEGAPKKVTSNCSPPQRYWANRPQSLSARPVPPGRWRRAKAAGAAKIYVAEADFVDDYLLVPQVDVLASLVESASPAAVLLAASADGKEIAGRLAARIGTGVLVDVVEVQELTTGVPFDLRWRFTPSTRRPRATSRSSPCGPARSRRSPPRAPASRSASTFRNLPKMRRRSRPASPRLPATARS